jgi:hypothetical protein
MPSRLFWLRWSCNCWRLEKAHRNGIEDSSMESLPQSKRGFRPISCGKATCAAAGHVALVVRAAVLPLVLAGCAGAQSNPPDALWSGQVQCVVTLQSAEYTHQETQTWKLTGAPPTPGPMAVYPANWSVTGQGSTLRTVNAQAISAGWKTNVSPANATIAIFVRASDQRLVIKSYHEQLYSAGGIAGTKQVAIAGAAAAQSNLSLPAYEWQFPKIEGEATSTNISGSGTVAVAGTLLPLHSAASNEVANCTWQFQRGAGGGTVPSARIMNPNYDNTPPDPAITKIDPAGASQGAQGVAVTITGSNTHFAQNLTKVDFGSGITVLSPITINSPTSATVQLNVDANATPGTRAVNVLADALGDMAQTQFTVTGSVASNNSNPPGSTGGTAQGQSVSAQGNNSCLTSSGDIVQNFNSMKADVVQQFGQLIQEAIDPATQQSLQTQETKTLADLDAEEQKDLQSTSSGCTTGATQAGTAPTSGGGSTSGGNTGGSNTGSGNASSTSSSPTSTVPSAPSGQPGLAPRTLPVAVPTATLLATNPASTPRTVPSMASSPATKSTMPGAPAQGAASASSGNYLVTITRLTCIKQTLDDPLQKDGKGDEIYAAAFYRRYDRKTAANLEMSEVQTRVYGDIYQAPDRIQAGTRSAAGGIQSGDMIPDGALPQRTLPPQVSQFPLLVWQGALTDGADALLISPSIWESDGNPQLFSGWVQSQTTLSNSIFLATKVQNEIGSKVFQPLTLGTGEGISGSLAQATAQTAVLAAFGLPPVLTLFSAPQDRPIGLQGTKDANGVDTALLPNTTVVLTREIIEQALRSSSGGGQSALMTITFADNFAVLNGVLDLPGTYLMVLEVERQ